MIPSQAILDQMANLLATDTTTIAPAAGGCKVALVKSSFTPAPDLAIGSLTLADFTGSTPLAAGTGNQQDFTDPVTGDRIVQMLEPAGGWHWAPSDAVNLPQTIYGYILTDNAGTTLYGSALLTNPLTLTAAGQGVDLPEVRFQLLSNGVV